MVNVPASLTETGKRERHFHKTRDLAKNHATHLREKLTDHGSAASLIRPALAEDAVKAACLLEPWGLSLTQAAQKLTSLLNQESASKVIEEAYKAWALTHDGLRERSIKSYETTMKRVMKALPQRVLATLTAEEITKSIRTPGNSQATYALHRRNVRAFWNWCARKGWCDKEIFELVEAPRKPSDKEIEFLSPLEAEHLLRTAEAYYPQAVPMYAVALFTGVRAEELKRLEEHHFTEEGINLPSEITKRGRRRHITYSETLKEWLKAHPFVPCPNWRNVDTAVRRLAGWDVSSQLLTKPPKPTCGKWPQNALRHTHASYAIAAGTPLDAMLFEFGHVGGVEMLRKHYLGRATKSQAHAFYQLRPS